MKILLWVPEYPPHHIWWGGEVFKNLAEGYKKEGHEVVVIYWYYKAKWFDEIKKSIHNDITFYQIPEIPFPRKLPFLKTVMPIWIINYFELKKIIKHENIDVANIHWYWHLFIDAVWRCCKSLNIQYVFTNHWYPKIPLQKWPFIKAIWKTYMFLIWESLNKNSKKITCVSEYTKSEYNKYWDKISVIPNGINPPNNFSKEEIQSLRKSFSTDKKILLSVWRITKYTTNNEQELTTP